MRRAHFTEGAKDKISYNGCQLTQIRLIIFDPLNPLIGTHQPLPFGKKIAPTLPPRDPFFGAGSLALAQ